MKQERKFQEPCPGNNVHDAAVVAAIDFGTTYSGWAYSLRTDLEVDRTKAYSKYWNSGSTQTEKTPTCILIRPDGQTVEAFGYDAEDRYRDLTESGEHVNYYYFRRFKMSLCRKIGEKLNRNMTIEDVMNRSLPALDVFAMSIRFLKDDLLSAVQRSILGGVRKQDMNWVLTVPAIWTDGAKQFMREAAIKAGIERRRLTIALEPEAASMYCCHLPVEATVCNTGVSISSFQVWTRYMVLDAGGGTIDITVHEVDTDNGVKEVHAACGGGWGGTTVDEEFENLLTDLLTEDGYLQFKMENMDDWCDLWRDFEVTKRAITAAANTSVRMRLPQSLGDTMHRLNKGSLSNIISRSRFTDDITLVQDKIKFSPEISKSWFHISVDKTIDLVRSILSRDLDITAILMVGRLSESSVLQDAVRSAFNNIKVLIPREESYSILKGALIFGHLPKVVTERVLKYTYGVSSFDTFVEGHHPESRRLKTDVGVVCRNILSKHVEINQRVRAGEPQVWHAYNLQFKSQTQMEISLYASEKPNPIYTDQGCFFVGKMSVDISDQSDALD
ncbi:heat shock 70 kDa protein 12A-like [Mercenaria mercenaria]|uniref:heat shock 70 kDa protein 12A-like n=1 Tax=Mercenaria mercenaria TaxID=6596 RepID=UPI00234EC7F0|nr:heat shock 70 kDa protein 12A-like [Mercenaria mercenaria]